MEKNNHDLTRRSFLGLGAGVALATGIGVVGCTPRPEENTSPKATSTDTPSETTKEPSFLRSPDPIDESLVTETIMVDVCVVGLGLAGIAALREAAEQGATTFGFDKGTGLGYRSGEFGSFGSERIHKTLGIEEVAAEEVVSELMKAMGNRPNANLLTYWIQNTGKDLDWYIETVDYELLQHDYDNPQGDKEMIILPERFPVLDTFKWREENYINFPGLVHLLPDHGPAMHGSQIAAEEHGAQIRFNMKGEQLIKEGDRIIGVYATDSTGNVVRINAKKGVILSTGDMSSDDEMLAYYTPHATKHMRYFSTMDAEGNPVNTGDGHKMALWAGAAMELGPLAPMTHSLGTNSIGTNPYLMVNMRGKRFTNEDVGAQELQNAIVRQPEGQAWQIFDSKWPEQLEFMPQNFGGVSHFVPEDQYDQYQHIIEHFDGGYATPSYFRSEVEDGEIIEAETLEELAEKIGVPYESFAQTVERYNELAHAQHDSDMNKVTSRLFPLENSPYYAVNFGDSGLLVVIGGIDCDESLHALDAEKNIIPGLYVAGNTQGGRFLVDYPVTVAGASHSMALSFGRLAGRSAAQGI